LHPQDAMHDLPRLSRGVDYITIQPDPGWSSASDNGGPENLPPAISDLLGYHRTISVISRYGVKGACIALTIPSAEPRSDDNSARLVLTQTSSTPHVITRLQGRRGGLHRYKPNLLEELLPQGPKCRADIVLYSMLSHGVDYIFILSSIVDLAIII